MGVECAASSSRSLPLPQLSLSGALHRWVAICVPLPPWAAAEAAGDDGQDAQRVACVARSVHGAMRRTVPHTAHDGQRRANRVLCSDQRC